MVFTITIMPDFGNAIFWLKKGDFETFRGMGDLCGLPGVRVGTKMRSHPLQKDFEEWQSEFERSFTQIMNDQFDWREFHREGLRLARKLKKSLGDRYRIVYEKPAEDPSCHYNTYREIMMDGRLLVLRRKSEINSELGIKPSESND